MNEFNGFDEPTSNYSKLPHQLIDNLSIIKSSGELKAILYVLRHTWGFGEYEDWQVKQITTDEFINGRKKSDGQRLDGGIKVSKPTLYKGLDEAVEHGFLVRYVDNTDLGRVTHYYRLRSPDDTESVLYATDPDRPGTSPWHTIDKEIKDRVYKRFQGRCAYCEGKSRKWHYDHIVPLAQGGPSEFENLALSCPPCNLTKSNRTPDQWGRQVVFYDENDVKKVYRGWSNFFTGGGKDSLPRTEKETKRKKNKKDILSPADLLQDGTLKQPEIITDQEETTQQLMFGVLCKVMKRDPGIEKGRTGTFASKLIKGGYTHHQIDLWYSPGNNYYWKVYYKGAEKGEHPNESDITKTLIPSKEYQEKLPEHKEIELTPEIEELESHFENLTGFYVPVSYTERQELWIKPCNAMLARSEGLDAAKKLMDTALDKARVGGYSYKAPSSLLTFALNHAENGSTARQIEDEVGGYYV